jgi:hypothetical protein
VGHLAKECPGKRPSFICCKAMDHQVLGLLRMIINLEEMSLNKENPKVDPKMEESEKVLLQINETLNDH